jgi:hypothetical protein
MTKQQWEEARQISFKAENTQKQIAQANKARAIHISENQNRPNNIKIQSNDINYIKMAANKAKDINDFLNVI